jgi:hypothetical protein
VPQWGSVFYGRNKYAAVLNRKEQGTRSALCKTDLFICTAHGERQKKRKSWVNVCAAGEENIKDRNIFFFTAAAEVTATATAAAAAAAKQKRSPDGAAAVLSPFE